MFQAPRAQWPQRNEEKQRLLQALQDDLALRRYAEVTRRLDRVDFHLGDGADVIVGNDIWWHFSPVDFSILYELRAEAKIAGGGGPLTLRARVSGAVYDLVTLPAGNGAVVRVTPASQILLTPTDILAVDCTAAAAGWQFVTFTMIMEPRFIDVS